MELGATEIVLALAALLVGATGTWSPCGFSMVETIGPTGHTGGRPTALAACATFLPGALAGALLAFGGLALVGEVVHGAGGSLAYAIAAAIALIAAVAEARGARIAPQVRRQLPEHWRRVMPMPVAAALYGVLLGLGFTTFVLSFGVWALAGIALAIGEPGTGLAIGLGFGVGRALPIVALAPIADRELGQRAVALMAERPELYRGIRLGDAALLAVVAALLAGGVASADVKRVSGAADPFIAGGDLVFQRGDRDAWLRRGAGPAVQLSGKDPAIGGPYIALRRAGEIVILRRSSGDQVASFAAPNADAVAVSKRAIAWRVRKSGRDRIRWRRLRAGGRLGKQRVIAKVGRKAQLGRPSVDGARAAFAVAKRSANRIVVYRPGKGKRTVIRSVTAGLSNPSLGGKRILYVRHTRKRDQLRLRRIGGGDRGLLSRKGPTLWTTALGKKRAYVTVLKGRKPRARIISKRL
ncbi:MAG TPA: hypothetical protein VIL04_04520 [Solirubrobacterales bacterium]|jgi:hypothetical protein